MERLGSLKSHIPQVHTIIVVHTDKNNSPSPLTHTVESSPSVKSVASDLAELSLTSLTSTSESNSSSTSSSSSRTLSEDSRRPPHRTQCKSCESLTDISPSCVQPHLVSVVCVSGTHSYPTSYSSTVQQTTQET